jgi:hypothetical protein
MRFQLRTSSQKLLTFATLEMAFYIARSFTISHITGFSEFFTACLSETQRFWQLRDVRRWRRKPAQPFFWSP